MIVSEFICLGIAYAISNRQLKSRDLEVILPEYSANISGDIFETAVSMTYMVKDSSGNITADKLSGSAGITATWLPMTSNTPEPPTVRRGERVLLYHQKGTELYWWTETGLDDHLRRLDTKIIALSNVSDLESGEFGLKNSYWLEFSTATKRFSVNTSKSDGESYKYSFTIDARNGEAYLTDDQDNKLHVVSAERKIEMTNADGSRVTVIKDKVECETSLGAKSTLDGEDITYTNAEGSIHSMIGDTLTLSSPAGGKLVIDADVVIENSAGAKVSLTGTNVTNDNGAGAKVSLDGPSVSIEDGAGGMINVAGGLVSSN